MTEKKPNIEISPIKIRFRAWKIISDAVEQGINWGWQHAHKHTDDPHEDLIKEKIHDDIMSELCDVIKDWGDNDEI